MFPWTEPTRPLRFDAFMEAALHDPEQGYYARRIRDVGRRGDFTTAAGIAPGLLGRALAGWAGGALRATGCRDLIELGPGTGVLAAELRRHLPWPLRLRTRLHLVERSQPLRELQRQKLGSRVRWHETIDEALEASGGRACLYSNEFFDAFPVRRFRRASDGWQEQQVLPGAERWVRVEQLPATTLDERDWPQGQVIEVGESQQQWLEELLAVWRSGRMLTIDYGATAGRLLERRPRGTLRGYFHHQLVEGPELLARAGHQDLTADVNFSDLIAWPGERLRTMRLVPQHEFLAPHLRRADAGERHLLDPHGAGAAFLFLEQERTPA